MILTRVTGIKMKDFWNGYHNPNYEILSKEIISF